MTVKNIPTIGAIAFVSLTILLTTPLTSVAQNCDFSVGGACSRTSSAAIRACRHEVRDDYWIAVGICRNESSGRAACIDDARDERGEGLGECVEVCSARQDICDALGQDRYDPPIDPANFMPPSAVAANPNTYFPLIPGLELVYEVEDETIVVTVTGETKTILGVECIVVRDTVTVDGVLLEDTYDWYAQDLDGNVWYFGELSQNYDEDGELVDLEGSWVSGVEGAKPGILMLANPVVGAVYRQEWFLGEAEDIGEVLSVTGTESVPAASCTGNCLVTADTLPFEPDVVEHKYYAPGIGVILEIDIDSGERVELISVTGP
jgi:hypothetical protein